MKKDVSVELNHHRIVRLQTLCDSVHMAMVHASVGDIAEFGIAGGASAQVIAATIAALDHVSVQLGLPRKKFHAFDSFQGLPKATLPEDTASPMVSSGVWGPGTCPSAGIPAITAMLQKHLAPERFRLYPGWFSETLPHLDAGTRFSLVHLDCDLYESSLQVLTDLFENERFSDGCILLCDDFMCNRGSKKLGQRRAWEECVAKYKPDFTDLGFYGIESWRCVIHTN